MMQPGMMQPGMMQPGMSPLGMMAQRPPPPGCPMGGAYRMVKWEGPQTQQKKQCLALVGCLFLGAWGAGLICCCLAAAIQPEDEKEVYSVNGINYTPTGLVDENVGPARGRGGKR